MTVAEALRAIDPREARILLAHASGFSLASLIAHPERRLPQAVVSSYRSMCERRAAGEPIAYIVGRKEFYGLDLEVGPAVLVPRPETELLVELALARPWRSAVDLGTGSGAVALALKRNRPGSRVVAVESSTAALAVARRNAAALALDVDFVRGCWYEPLAGEKFELIVSNPPYVVMGDAHLADLRYEPVEALVGGPDGLDALRSVAAGSTQHLRPGGWLLVEHGLGQDEAVRALLAAAGLEEVATWPDLAGIGRISGGRR